jgi:hypothetical protein
MFDHSTYNALVVVRLRRMVSMVVLVASVTGSVALWRKTPVRVNDFTAFWIAGHSLLAQRNPYDADYALPVERSMGFTQEKPLVMRNPPWALWSTLPLGVLNYGTAWLLWTSCLLLLLVFSARLLWMIYGGSQGQRWTAVLLTFLFAPTLACLSVGQTAPIVLLGLTLFLYLHSRHEFWAGFALLAPAFKPQLAFLFWLILAVWSIQRRKWRLIAGAVSSMALATAIALLLDHQVIRQYRIMLASESLQTQFIPTLGGFLRQLFGPAWLQLVPAIIGIAWVAVYYCRYQHAWCWKQRLPVLLLASMLLTPYAWLVDEVVVLIALFGAAAAIPQARLVMWLGIPFVLVNAAIVTALALGVRAVSPYYLWTMWVWIFFYFAITAYNSKRE